MIINSRGRHRVMILPLVFILFMVLRRRYAAYKQKMALVDLWHRRLRASPKAIIPRRSAASPHPSARCIRPRHARSAYCDHAASPLRRRNVSRPRYAHSAYWTMRHAPMSVQCMHPRHAHNAYWTSRHRPNVRTMCPPALCA